MPGPPRFVRVLALVSVFAASMARAQVVPLDHVVAAVGGTGHACALRDDAGVVCWGVNNRGQLGDGSTSVRRLPVRVPGLAQVTQLAANQYYTCAVAGGAAKCWGDNVNGTLGDGTTTQRNQPTPVSGLGSGVSAVATGNYHACALQNGGVKCWGDNTLGQLGNGGFSPSLVPVAVNGLGSGVIGLTAGYQHTCALLAGGTIRCWGVNDVGELGNGAPGSPRPNPVTVSGISGASAVVAAGVGYFTCALVGGAVKCWGYNYYGQIGDGSYLDRSTPVAVSGLGSGMAQLALGARFGCARSNAGAVQCWGEGQSGTLGNDSLRGRTTPVGVLALGGTPSVIGSASDAGYAVIGGRLRGWGCANCLLLGNDFQSEVSSATPIAGTPFSATAVAAGSYQTCAIASDGGVRCWGWGESGQLGFVAAQRSLPNAVPGLAGIARLAVSRGYACAASASQTSCWGDNSYGQLGDGTQTSRAAPAAVSALGGNLLSLATGAYHACAVTSGGAAKCWGDNRYGQLGDNGTTLRTTPVTPSGLGSGVAAVGAGANFSCALIGGGAVACWGANDSGQLGDGSTTPHLTPGLVSGLSGATRLAVGDAHACALVGAALKCWGDNSLGQLGDGTRTNRATPVTPFGLGSGVSRVDLAFHHSCALTASGPRCWGANVSDVPSAVSGLASADAMAPGFEHTCALSAGSVRCWGYNGYGEMGNGQSGTEALPIDVLQADRIFADGFGEL